MNETLEQTIQAVLSSPKYQNISPELVARIAGQEFVKRASLKETIKATKNKLHQIGGAYLERPTDYAQWLKALKVLPPGDQSALKAACQRILAGHASTRERLPILDVFYNQLLSQIPPIHSILDIACGFNPLALPWMALQPGTTYLAWDIYADMIAFINEFLRLAGQAGQAEVRDILAYTETPDVDLALVLKTIPCLEQVDKQAGSKLLASIHARFILLSFPAHSLGGFDKGMPAHYEAAFHQLAAGKDWQVQRFEFASELVFLIEKG